MTSKTLTDFLQHNLEHLRLNGYYNEIDELQGPNGPIVTIQGRELVNLSSNNYLGLANDPRLVDASLKALHKYGVGAGAVRTINGTMDIHSELERKLAVFKHTEAAIAYQSGFNCNMAAISAVMNANDAILSDEWNHASIIDGCRLSKAQIIRFRHADMAHLEEKARLARATGQFGKIMVITDGVFSMDGDIAKLPEIVDIAQRYDLITYVDDAHGSGVLGNGSGTVKHFGLSGHIDFQIGTLSKALGVVGGYVAGRKELIHWLKAQSRPFLFSTAAPPAIVAACIAAIDIMEDSGTLQKKLWANAAYFREGLNRLGFNTGQTETPIVPCIIGDERLTQLFSRQLNEEGVYAKAIVFPTVPKGTGRVRNMPTAAHTKEMLDQALAIYEKVKDVVLEQACTAKESQS